MEALVDHGNPVRPKVQGGSVEAASSVGKQGVCHALGVYPMELGSLLAAASSTIHAATRLGLDNDDG